MKRIGFLTLTSLLSFAACSQTFIVQSGVSVSNLDWVYKGTDLPSFYTQKLAGYSFFMGVDYADRRYVNLSSNIGIIRRGGKDEVTFYDMTGTPLKTVVEKPTLDYVSLNTIAYLKYTVGRVTPFIGIGPRVDFLVNSSDHFEPAEDHDGLNSVAAGLVLGGGIKYDLKAFQVGIRSHYYLDFTKVADWNVRNTTSAGGGQVTVNTFDVNLSVGYKLN